MLLALAKDVYVNLKLCHVHNNVLHVLQRSFAYDVADLYKAETSIPIAFEMAATVRDNFENKIPSDFASMVRRRLRDEIVRLHLLEQMVKDIKYLFADGINKEDDRKEPVYLWDNLKELVANGKQYHE